VNNNFTPHLTPLFIVNILLFFQENSLKYKLTSHIHQGKITPVTCKGSPLCLNRVKIYASVLRLILFALMAGRVAGAGHSSYLDAGVVQLAFAVCVFADHAALDVTADGEVAVEACGYVISGQECMAAMVVFDDSAHIVVAETAISAFWYTSMRIAALYFHVLTFFLFGFGFHALRSDGREFLLGP
jgi:hypothetical protein